MQPAHRDHCFPKAIPRSKNRNEKVSGCGRDDILGRVEPPQRTLAFQLGACQLTRVRVSGVRANTLQRDMNHPTQRDALARANVGAQQIRPADAFADRQQHGDGRRRCWWFLKAAAAQA
jgi:hypothetical protein